MQQEKREPLKAFNFSYNYAADWISNWIFFSLNIGAGSLHTESSPKMSFIMKVNI